MIIGVGLDLVDINELQSEIDEKREPWLKRVFTAGERAYCAQQPNPYRHFAGTLAAKEATLKALGTGWTDQTDWQHIEIIRDQEKPSIVLYGSTRELSNRLDVGRQFVSITHTQVHAAAIVILES